MPITSSIHSGWDYDPNNTRLDFYYRGTRAGSVNATGITSVGTITAATGITVTAGGATVTAGNMVTTAGDMRVSAANYRLGVVSAFATSEPTSAMVFKTGTAPAGAITTSGGVFSSATVMRRIVAAGTVTNIEA